MKRAKQAIERHHEILSQCIVCSEKPLFEGLGGLIAHLTSEHGDLVPVDDAGKTRLRQRGIQFLDGTDWYSNTYDILLADEDRVVGGYSESGPRGRDDPMAIAE